MIQIKRIYLPMETSDGYRVLVDRLWPRGIKKEEAKVHLWAKDVSPSNTLRKWFDHDPEKFKVFKQKYLHELQANEAVIGFLEKIEPHQMVTLLYAAKDEKNNHAVVLLDFLRQRSI